MKFATLLVVTLIMTTVMCEETYGFKEEDDVVILTTANFDEAIAKFDHVLVEFYAPWCGHCKKLAPEYSEAAAILKKSNPAVPLAKIDGTIEKDLATRFNIQGFPTLKWFTKGQESEYKGGRTKAEIVEWISKKTGPPSKTIADAAGLKELQTDNKVLVVFHGADSEAGFEAFQAVADSTEGVVFASSTSAEVNAGAARVVLYKQFDEGQNDFNGTVDKESLTEFVETNRYELVMPFEGEEPINRIFQKENAALVLFSDKSGDHETAFSEFAKNNRGRIVYALSRTNEGLGQRLAEYIGVKAEDAPCVRLINPANGDLSKFVYSGAIDQESLGAYLSSFEAGTLERSFKSASTPATNDEPVKVVVGENFADIVTNSGKDVLLEFYAPWCGHCKTLAPKYDEAAKQLAYLSDRLTIAKIDATENEVPGISVQGFPTLKFFKAGNPEAIEYDGARETEGIVEWLKKNVSFEWVEAVTQESDL